LIPVWLRIMVVLMKGHINLRGLCRELAPSSYATIYRHLEWLERIGWVISHTDERLGRMRIIRLTEEGVRIAKLCVELYDNIKEVERF